MEQVVGVSHECDFPGEANKQPRVTHCPVSRSRGTALTSREMDESVRSALRDNGTIYVIDESLLRKLRPDVILTQKLCDVPERADKLVIQLSDRVEGVRRRASRIAHWPRCFLMEWVDPPFCSGHWGPELVEIAGGYDPLGRKHQPSVQIEWQEIVDMQPDVIVLALCGYDIDRARRDYTILQHFSDFDKLPAAQSGNVYVVDANAYFARPGPRIVDSVEILAGIVHPTEFPEFVSRGDDDPRVVRVG